MKKLLATLVAALAVMTAPTAQAVILDLTTPDASGMLGGVLFMQNGHIPHGSGVSHDFLRMGNGSTSVETGFNTDARPLGPDLADVNSSPIFTRSLRVRDLLTLNGNSVFRLDINQTASRPLLSMDLFQIYLAPTGDINSLADLTSQNLLYDMGLGNKVYLNYVLESGSGESDMDAFVPSAWFLGHENDYLYARATFGATGGDYAANDGDEQWSALTSTPVTPVPEPPTFLLTSLGLGLMVAGMTVKKQLG